MLISLYVENIAIIKNISLDFDMGFTILTGETGAGKSILIDSIGLILGNKSRRELIGPFGEYAIVKAVFSKLPEGAIKLLSENDIKLIEDELFIERKIGKDGRTVAKINGIQVPVSLLQTLAPLLINIHGQHDHISMLNSNMHIELLDRFSNLSSDVQVYRQEYQNLKICRDNLAKLQMKVEQRESQLNHLSFKLQEYENVQPYIGMLSYLKERRKILQNQKAIEDFYYSIYLNDENSLNAVISNAISKINNITEIDTRFKELFDQLCVMQELSTSITAESEDIVSEFNTEETLSDIEDKLYALQQLLNRYGPTEEELLIDWENTQKEFDSINSIDEFLFKGKEAYLAQHQKVQKIATNLSKKRCEYAKKLSQLVQQQLSFLDMKGVIFEVKVDNQFNEKGGYIYNGRGFDRVEFLISTNAGQSLKPLQKIASGGELSRIMLGLTNVLKNDQVGTLIFDEVDSGVSGKTAEKIGVKLEEISHNRQVICITHLAQIASMGNQHFKIKKATINNQTKTEVTLLNDKDRIEEISRIIGGIEITDTIRQTAHEMLHRS